MTVHKSESEVAKILAIDTKLPGNDKKRSMELDRLRYKGNFYHNLKILKTGGELKVYRRPGPGEDVAASMFKPCIHCLAFIRQNELWRHVRQCPFNNEKSDDSGDSPVVHRRLQFESEMLLYPSQVPDGCSPGLRSAVLSSMKCDEVSRVVKSDRLIMMVSSSLLEKGNATKTQYISQRMRTLGRLLLELQERVVDDSKDIASFVSTIHFDLIVDATKSLAGYTEASLDTNSSLKKPGLALNIGYDLKKVAILLRGQALRERNTAILENANSFLQLFDLEWKNKIVSAALRSLGDKSFRKPDVLPLTEDLLKLRQYISNEIPQMIARLKANPGLQEWRILAETTAARLITFNKRRGNEGTKLTIEEFVNRPKWQEFQLAEVFDSLPPLEKELCKR